MTCNQYRRTGVPSGPEDVTEQEAIAKSRNGDHAAFAWIVKEYKHMAYTVAMRVLRHREEAEEVTQDAFVKAYQNLAGYQGGSKFSTWLFSITYRTAISKLRARRSATSDLDSVPEMFASTVDNDRVEAGDRRAALEIALSRLSPEDATVVSLFYLHEQNVEEIVTATGLSASNVKVKLHRSRKKLFEILNQHLKEEVWELQED
jgi:RNA polymerase sigma factor (sigma-70 family)